MSFQLVLPALLESQPASQLSSDETDVQLSQEQSLCLVKIFLNASLGCICFARGLIPSDSPTYQDRRVDDLVLIPLTSSPASYHNFLSFSGQLSVNNESQLFKVLVGGKDKRADHILNLVVSQCSRHYQVLKRLLEGATKSMA
jgi:HORMA domain